MESLSQVFYDEANEMVEQMEQILLTLEERGADSEAVNALFRHAHSLKGNSAAMGFMHISRFTHGLENVLETIRKGKQAITKEMTDLLLKGVDVIRQLLEGSRTHGDVDDPNCEPIMKRLHALLGEESDHKKAPTRKKQEKPVEAADPTWNPPSSGPETQPGSLYRVRYNPSPMLSTENDPLRILNEIKEYAQIRHCSFQENVPPLDQLKPDACYLGWELEIWTEFEPAILRAVLELSADGASTDITPIGTGNEPLSTEELLSHVTSEAGDANEKKPASAKSSAEASPSRKVTDTQTIRVATEKIDVLFNLVSEIVITQSMLSNAQTRIEDEEIRNAITHMERHVRELHERVMAVRMIPVGFVFNRFPRLVRDVAASLQKQIHLEITGEETELDRTLLESLTDPLIHLIRNAVDHGIESPEERRADGKSPTGTVALNAYQAEGRIYIEVSDDGRGIDPEKIRMKAIQHGWLREDDPISAESLYEFLFRPGFSTSEQVSDLSGRGVGMDVVKRNVENLGGMISIHSELGKGSRFVIKVPLTLAIMDGLTLRVGNELYIVPLTSVIEAFQPRETALCSMLGAHEMVNVRGRLLSLIKLDDLYGVEAHNRSENRPMLVVVEQEGQQVVLQVHEIICQQQVVMKSLEENFMRVNGFSGATILGDGRVALILDIGDLIRRAQTSSASPLSAVA